MASKKQSKINEDPTAELLRDLLIVELYKAGVLGSEIRKLIGCDMNRISRITKVLNKAKSRSAD